MNKSIILAALSLVATGVTGCAKSIGAQRVAEQETVSPTRGMIVREISCSGTIRSSVRAAVRAETGGKVEKLFVSPGDDVEAGQVVLRLANPQLHRMRRELEQQLKIKELEVTKAQAKLKVPAEAETTERLALDVQIAEAELAIVKLKAESNAEAIAKLTVCALNRGRVVSVDVAEGDLVTGAHEYSIGSQLYQITSTSDFVVDVNLGERDVSLLTKEAPVKLTLPSLRNLNVEGRIVRISEAARQGERAAVFPVEIAFTSENPLLKIGLSARATIEMERQTEALLVPIECVRYAHDGAYIVEKQGKDLRRRPIKTGIVTEDLVEIQEGLEEGAFLMRFAKI